MPAEHKHGHLTFLKMCWTYASACNTSPNQQFAQRTTYWLYLCISTSTAESPAWSWAPHWLVLASDILILCNTMHILRCALWDTCCQLHATTTCPCRAQAREPECPKDTVTHETVTIAAWAGRQLVWWTTTAPVRFSLPYPLPCAAFRPHTSACHPAWLACFFVFAFGLCLVPVGKALSIGHRVWLPPEALGVQGAVVPNLFDFGGTLGCLSVDVISKHEVFSFPVL